MDTMSVLSASVWSLCSNCSVSLQVFFGRNCSRCRHRFDVSVGGDELRVFLWLCLVMSTSMTTLGRKVLCSSFLHCRL